MAIKTPLSSKSEGADAAPEEIVKPLALWRVLILGLLLIPVNVFWTIIVEVQWYTLDGTDLPLFVTPVFILFILVLLNLVWRKIFPRANPMRQEELLLLYIMLVVSCTFAGEDTLQNLFGSITYPYWHATTANKWQSLFFPYLPKWLLITDLPALTAMNHGNVNLYSPQGLIYLRAWILPLTCWGLFFMTLVGMYLCLTIIVRRAWIENEKLTFPIVQLPLAMTSETAGATFFKNPVTWAGFGVAFSISFLNGLHTLIPTIPELNVKLFNLSSIINTRPWSAIGSTQTSFYPFAIGLGYFMPLDLSFSCWFFYVAARVFRVVGNVYGWDAAQNNGQSSSFPYFGEQATGAWLGLGVMLIYAGRTYWRQVGETAWLGVRSDDPVEARRYRAAFIGLVVGGLLLALFAALIGISGWVALAFFGIVFLLGFVITRVRAEFGSPHEINWVNPVQVLVTLFGTRSIGAHDLTLLSMLYWFNRGYRNHPMPNQLEAFKMLDNKPSVGIGKLSAVLIFASVISLVTTYWAHLHILYTYGGEGKLPGFKNWTGAESYDRLAGWLNQPVPPASTGLYYIAAGLALTIALSLMRINFVWWPFHPAGYALALSYAMEYFWLPIFIAWLLKFLIIRYGGISLHRRAIPFFLGLILGDYTMGALWAIVGPVMGIPTYKIYI
ncbi:MAG: DUF6785 family protein [Janthinobacterium lividum]